MELGIANAESLKRFVNNKKPVVPDYRASECLHKMSSAQLRNYLAFKPQVKITSDVVEYLTKDPKKLQSAVNTSSLSKINWSELPTKLMNFAKRIK